MKGFNNIVKVVACTTLCAAATIVNAGTMGPPIQQNKWGYFIGLKGGYSMSNGDALQPQTNLGTNLIVANDLPWDRSIGSAGMAGIFAGLMFNPNFGLQLSYSYRDAYQWRVDSAWASTNPTTFAIYQANSNIQTVMMDIVFKPSVNWVDFKPYINGGIGWARNHLNPLSFSNWSQTFNYIYQNHTENNFAWEAGIGADYVYKKHWAVGLGYQFVAAGTMSSGSNLAVANPFIANPVNAFKARQVLLHEVFASISYVCDAV